ncbi:MAG: hypothetical protein MNSN_01630 [Minisyncoccus archaeiphilus]|uniref:phage portal protein n=1 Tax=Minisyncoccus archaeiphilus TaxID=3238481 RepID=UPI002B19952B|nr:MAG: hypothetical protein MNSN_01630 [Candidatus Parcubacteria bacterium]
MNFITKTFKKIVKSALGFSDSFVTFFGGGSFGAEVMDRYKGWSYACIRAIAEDLASIKLHLYKVKTNGDWEEIKKHELLDLLKFPNDEQTGFDFWFMIFSHLELCGDSFVLLDGVKDEKGTPDALRILIPSHVTSKKEGLPKRIVSYSYREGVDSATYQKCQVLHLRYPNPESTTDGKGTVEAAIEWIDQDNYATRTNKNFFLNGARLGGFLTNQEETDPEILQRMKYDFEDAVAGVDNHYKVVSLPAGTDFKEGSVNPKDMDFANLQDRMMIKILAAFRVPKTVLGISDDVNRANAEATNYVFALRTIKPKMQMIVDALNAFLVPRFGDDLVLDFEDPVPENRELVIKEAAAAESCLSKNEIRERYYGAPSLENGGDVVMEDFNKVPLGKVPSKSVNRFSEKFTPFRGEKERAASRVKEFSESISDKAISIAIKAISNAPGFRTKSCKDLLDMTDEDFEELVYKGFVSRVTQYEKLMISKIKDFNAGQLEEVLKNLTEEMKAFEDDLFDSKEAISALIKLIEPIVVDLYEKEGSEALEVIGLKPFDILKPNVRKAITEGVGLMSKTYNETTKALLIEKLSQGYEDGLDLRQMKNLVKDIYEFNDNYRALTVAKTETFRAANAANKEAWKQSGTVKTIKWFTAADDQVCDFCGPMHNKTIGIEENFFNKGDEVVGNDGKTMKVDYSDVGSPPLHPHCRCYIRPEKISIN